MYLKIAMFEFPSLDVRNENDSFYPLTIWIHTTFLVIPHFVKVVSIQVNPYCMMAILV